MRKIRHYVGFCLHAVVASVIFFSAGIKFLEFIRGRDPSDGAQAYVLLLGLAELLNALLLLIPRTMSVGILLTSAGWGAVTALTLMQADEVVAPISSLVPVVLLVFTWIGGYLRDSRMLYSFTPAERSSPKPTT